MPPRRRKRQHVDMTYLGPHARWDPDEYTAWFNRNWDPENIRDLLAFAGAILVAYELIKKRVVDDVLGFYCNGFDDTGFTYSVEYDTNVLALCPVSVYRASCKWLVESGAITDEQVAVLDALHEARGRMSHELVGYLVDPSYTVRPGLLADVRDVLRSLVVFWARIAMDTNPDFDHQDIADEEIAAGDSLVFDQLLVVVARLERTDPEEEVPTRAEGEPPG